MITSENILVEQRGHLLLIGINRPEKKNAFTTEMLQALSAAYTELSDNPELRCGVVYATGSCFTAGLDLSKVMPDFVEQGAGVFVVEGGVDPYRNYGRSCAKPVILAVHGYCYTAGLELLLAADMCVAAEDTLFSQMEVARGIYPFGGATYRLPAAIGWHNAMRYMTTAETFTAQQGKAFGLVQEVVQGNPLAKAIELAELVAGNAPLAVQAVLKHARRVTDQPKEIQEALVKEFHEVANSEDSKEGVRSLIEKRKAVFKGR